MSRRKLYTPSISLPFHIVYIDCWHIYLSNCRADGLSDGERAEGERAKAPKNDNDEHSNINAELENFGSWRRHPSSTSPFALLDRGGGGAAAACCCACGESTEMCKKHFTLFGLAHILLPSSSASPSPPSPLDAFKLFCFVSFFRSLSQFFIFICFHLCAVWHSLRFECGVSCRGAVGSVCVFVCVCHYRYKCEAPKNISQLYRSMRCWLLPASRVLCVALNVGDGTTV